MDGVKEFLESSTIHGLSYISSSKNMLVKCFWLAVVITGFVVAAHFIHDSFNDWGESTVGTTEETLSIGEARFHKITVCPPRGLHTVLNQDIQESKNKCLENKTVRKMISLAHWLKN